MLETQTRLQESYKELQITVSLMSNEEARTITVTNSSTIFQNHHQAVRLERCFINGCIVLLSPSILELFMSFSGNVEQLSLDAKTHITI